MSRNRKLGLPRLLSFTLLLLLLAGAVARGQSGQIVLVQHAAIDPGTTTSASLAFTSNNTAGNWITVAIRAGQPGQTFTVTDTRGNTYRRAVQFNETGDGTTLGLFYAENISGGSNAVTVSDTLDGATLRFAILEYAGIATANSLDGSATAQGTSPSPTSGTATTTSNGDLVIGLLTTANPASFTAASGYVIQEQVPAAPNSKLIVEDRRQLTAGQISAGASLSDSDNWGGALAAFRPASGVSPRPDLSVTKAHSGGFTAGQIGATFTLTVTNIGAGPTIGTVTVTDTLPPGLTATALSGPNWSCTLATVSCTRSDVLGPQASYPVVTVTVTVAANAPSSVINQAAVAGGGEINTANNAASDPTVIGSSTSDTEPPTAPSNLTAAAASASQINLSWTASTDNVGVTGYMVERCQGAGCSNFVQVAVSAGTTYSNNGLIASTSYRYRVRATDAANNASAYSNSASATTPGATPITFVQANYSAPQTPQQVVVVPYPSAQTAGNLNVVVVGWNDSTAHAQSVTDSKGNAYALAVGPTVQTGIATQSIYYAPAIAAAAANGNAVTVRFDVPAQYPDIRIAEYSGIDSANPLDGVAGATGNSTLSNSGIVTTTAANDLLVGANVVQTPVTGPGSGYIQRLFTVPNAEILEDRLAAATGAYNATAPVAPAGAWLMQLVAFRAGSSGPPSRPDLTLTKTHSNPFTAGQIGAFYTLTVTNIGTGPTSGTATVTDTLPAGLTATALSGPNWTCTLATVSCARNDVLSPQASYPAITVTVTVAANAPSSVVNQAAVAGGGELNTGNDTVSDVTAIVRPSDTEPPSPPGTLTATAPDGTHIDLRWGASTDNVAVTNYRVERCPGVCTTTGFVKLASPTSTSFTDDGLAPNTTYSYVVRAEDAAGNLSAYSNVVTQMTSSATPELVAAYNFNEGAGTTAADASGNGNNGAIESAAWTAQGKYGGALTFNGTDSRVIIHDSPSLQLRTGMTLEAWVKPATVSAGWRDIIYKGTDNYYLMATTDRNGIPGGGGTFAEDTVTTFGSTTLPLNTWTHLAATYDGSALRLYVNGVQSSTAPVTGNMLTSAHPLELGGDDIFGQFFAGTIDEVRVYNVALTPAQIQTDMNRPTGGAIPVVSLSSARLDFGSLPTGTSSGVETVTVSNSGGAPLTIGGIAISGAHAGDFAQSNTCGAILQPNGHCTIDVTFTPVSTGARIAAISISDNAPGAPQTIELTGTGTGFSISPRTAVLTPTLAQQFSVSGGAGGVVWSVDGIDGGSPSTGTITPGGRYSPPARPGTHTVTVTTSDRQQASSATVYVTDYPGTFTHHNDNARTGQNLNETVLSPSNVNSATFGKVLEFSIDGVANASPLYVGKVNIPGQGYRNVVYVATQHDSVYAFDADGLSAGPLWHVSFLGPDVTTVPAEDTGECCDISPEIGITGTPVIDQSTGTLYVVAKTKEDGSSYVQRLHALDIATGEEKLGGPVVLEASVAGYGQGSSDGSVEFNALTENQRPALLLSDGVVYIGFGSHGDQQPFHGWLLGYDAATLEQVMAFNVSPDAEGGGIWQANGGPAVDAAGNIYFVTGNGTFNVDTSDSNAYGDSFIKITPDGVVLDYFTPYDQEVLSANNFDLGAAGPLLLPDQPGEHPHLLVSAGKNNTIYLVDRDSMGSYHAEGDENVQSLVNIFPFGVPEPGNYSAPVYFNGSIYFGPVADNVQAFQLSDGLLSTFATSRTSEVYQYPGAALAISANGSANGILWALQRNGDCGVEPSCEAAQPGVLRAYDASDLGLQLYASDQAGARDELDFAAKFSLPLVANGKVFVASMGKLTVYGLLP